MIILKDFKKTSTKIRCPLIWCFITVSEVILCQFEIYSGKNDMEKPSLVCIQKTLLLKLIQVTSDRKLFFESQLSSICIPILQEFGFALLSLSVNHCQGLAQPLPLLAKSHRLLCGSHSTTYFAIIKY